MRFRDRVALVTGAASGIGAATAERLAQEGAHVLVTDVDGEGGAKLAARITSGGGRASYHHLDAASGADWDALSAYVTRTWGRLDVLHSNAGRAIVVKPAHEFTEPEWQAQIGVSLTAAWLGVRAFIGLLRQARGAIVLTSSVHALAGLPGHPAYAAAKGALCALGRQLARARRSPRATGLARRRLPVRSRAEALDARPAPGRRWYRGSACILRPAPPA